MTRPRPENENQRLATLKRLHILDTDAEAFFNRIAEVTRKSFETPMAGIGLVDSDRVWYKAVSGRSLHERPRSGALSARTICDDAVTVVDDITSEDVRSDRFGTQFDGLQFYAGAPIIVDGARVGSVFIMDSQSRSFGPVNERVLSDLADAVAAHLEARKTRVQNTYLRSALEQASDAVVITKGDPIDPPGPRIIWANTAFSQLTGYNYEDLVGATPRILQGPKTSRSALKKIRRGLEDERSVDAEIVNYRADGTPYVASLHLTPVHNENGTVTHWVSVQRDVTDRERREEQLRHEATYDSLTGLPNRYAIREEIETQIASSDEPCTSALLYIDLDRADAADDSHRAHIGDPLLLETADVLREALRAHDNIGRMGDDEFVVCLTNLNSADEAHHVAQRLQKSLSASYRVRSEQIRIRASIGGTTCLSTYESADRALDTVVRAMLEARERNTNEPVFRPHPEHRGEPSSPPVDVTTT